MRSNHNSFTITPRASVSVLSAIIILTKKKLNDIQREILAYRFWWGLQLKLERSDTPIFIQWNLFLPCKIIMVKHLPSKLLQFTIRNIWLRIDMKPDSTKIAAMWKFAPQSESTTLLRESIISDCRLPAFQWLVTCWFKNGDDAHTLLRRFLHGEVLGWHHQQ